jgi:hypothetical protein
VALLDGIEQMLAPVSWARTRRPLRPKKVPWVAIPADTSSILRALFWPGPASSLRVATVDRDIPADGAHETVGKTGHRTPDGDTVGA